jgi:hypothetical protein
MLKFSQKAHAYAPKLWRSTANITGNHEFDASIEHCNNSDVRSRLATHIARDTPYNPLTATQGYDGYSGDN